MSRCRWSNPLPIDGPSLRGRGSAPSTCRSRTGTGLCASGEMLSGSPLCPRRTGRSAWAPVARSSWCSILAHGLVPRGTTGLYHLAIHLPSRKEFARAVGRLFARRYPNSPTDHVVTETTYLSDPDGNGVELTFETPERGRLIVTPDGLPGALDSGGTSTRPGTRSTWTPLFGELVPGEPLEAPLSEGAKIGHVHLHVADIKTRQCASTATL